MVYPLCRVFQHTEWDVGMNAKTMTPRYSVGETVDYIDDHNREQTGKIGYIEGRWHAGYTTLTYQISHPTYRNKRAYVSASEIN